MLKTSTNDSHPLILIPEVTQPALYLDYCVIVDLARKYPCLGKDLRDCLLNKGGTLYLSWAHLVELLGIAVGPTYNTIRAYLASFERSFVLIDNNARAVIDRESHWTPGMQNPAFAEYFLRELALNWRGQSELDVTTLLDVMTSNQSLLPKYKVRHSQHKSRIKQAVDQARTRYRSDPQAKHQLENTQYFHVVGTPPTKYIYDQMMRECIITHEIFNPSDSLDFEHSVVSLAYCDFVVLDKKWARRCKAITVPPEAAKVFANVVEEIEDLIHRINSWT